MAPQSDGDLGSAAGMRGEAIETQTLPRFLHDYPCWETRGYWAAQEKPTGTFLGWFEFRPLEERSSTLIELGYRLNQAAWGRGYATEGSRTLVHKGFAELQVERATANTMAVNTRSCRVMEKSGLSFVRNFTGDWPQVIEGSAQVKSSANPPGPSVSSTDRHQRPNSHLLAITQRKRIFASS